MNGDRALVLPADISIPEAYYKGYKDACKEFIDDLNKINKIVVGGCPKINILTEIFGMKKKWENKEK